MTAHVAGRCRLSAGKFLLQTADVINMIITAYPARSFASALHDTVAEHCVVFEIQCSKLILSSNLYRNIAFDVAIPCVSVYFYLYSQVMFTVVISSEHSRPSIRPVESHSGARENILAGPSHIFAGPFWKIFFKFFFFKMMHFCVFFISELGGPPNVSGPGVAYPLPHLSTGLPSIRLQRLKIKDNV